MCPNCGNKLGPDGKSSMPLLQWLRGLKPKDRFQNQDMEENMKYTVMDAAPKVSEHDIVQIVPEHQWGGSLVIVTKVKEWGIKGFVQIPLKGPSYIRLEHSDFKIVGQCAFVPAYK